MDVLDNVLFSDKEWFHLSGCMNSHISRMWSCEHPCLPRIALASLTNRGWSTILLTHGETPFL
jgi:hypothetical protein